MILHFLQKPTGVTSANWPLTELVTEEDGSVNSYSSFPFEVSLEDKLAVEEGTKDWEIIEGVVTTKPSDRKEKQEEAVKALEQSAVDTRNRKFELIKKVTLGTATLAEQEEFANLL